MTAHDAFLQKWANDLRQVGCSKQATERMQQSAHKIQHAIARHKRTEERIQEWEKRYNELRTKVKQLKGDLS